MSRGNCKNHNILDQNIASYLKSTHYSLHSKTATYIEFVYYNRLLLDSEKSAH